MKKIKYFIGIIFIVFSVLLFPNIVNAAVEYTRTFPSNDGSIIINLTGLTLDESKAYSFALVTKGGTPSTWHTIVEYTETTAQVTLGSSTTDIRNVLRVTDTGVLYVKNNSDDTYVVEGLQVNLKLPYLQAIPWHDANGRFYSFDSLYGLSAYSSDNLSEYVAWKKITDKDFVQKYLEVKENKKDISTLENYLPSVPTVGYEKSTIASYSDKNDGLYIAWIKYSANNCKDIYGCIIHDGLPEATKVEQYIEGLDVEAPTVTAISVFRPESGTYKTSQTIKISVLFNEKITGTTVPTLKIKFGDSSERSITNGTIKDKYIEYSYDIQDSDKGQLATVSLSGGTIKDAAGNDAKLSCPLISGNTIKANVEGTTTTNTDNQDKTNNEKSGNEEEDDKNSNNSGSAGSGATSNGSQINASTGSGTSNAQSASSASGNGTADSTTAKGSIPQAGVGVGIFIVIFATAGIAIFTYIKYNKFKSI